MWLKVTRHFYYQEITFIPPKCLGPLSFELKALSSPRMSKANNFTTRQELIDLLVQTFQFYCTANSGSRKGGGRRETKSWLTNSFILYLVNSTSVSLYSEEGLPGTEQSTVAFRWPSPALVLQVKGVKNEKGSWRRKKKPVKWSWLLLFPAD